MNLASLVINYMRQKNYVVSSNPGECNIIYIEGMNENGSLNNDTPNEFNDRRIVIDFINDSPRIINHWQATTEPGNHYTYNPLNAGGAARIAFGQYRAWCVGKHGYAEKHEALIQVKPVTVHRDFNQDFKRTGDRLDIGHFGINQHWGYDAPVADIKNTSAGCLVGRRRQGHREFMQIIKSDNRYQIDNNYIFYTTVIAGDDLLKYC